jgi:hypothetical protein
MRIRIKTTGFSDWDSMFYNNFLSIPVLAVFSLLFETWTTQNLTLNLYVTSPRFIAIYPDGLAKPTGNPQFVAIRHRLLWSRSCRDFSKLTPFSLGL